MKHYEILWDENPDINRKLADAFDQIVLHARIFPRYGKYGGHEGPLGGRRPLDFKFSNDIEDRINRILKKCKVHQYFRERQPGQLKTESRA